MARFGKKGSCTLYLHDEVDGALTYLKELKDLDDLKRTYEAISDREFEMNEAEIKDRSVVTVKRPNLDSPLVFQGIDPVLVDQYFGMTKVPGPHGMVTQMHNGHNVVVIVMGPENVRTCVRDFCKNYVPALIGHL